MFPSVVTVEVKDPSTGEVLWKKENVPVAALMQVAQGLEQGKSVVRELQGAFSDVQKAGDSLRRLFAKASR